MPILALLLPALVPAVVDGFRSVVGWLFGSSGAQPQNVEEAIKLMQAEVEKLKALAALDKPAGNISQWVADLRASFRYLAAALIILGTFGLTIAPGLGFPVEASVLAVAWEMMGAVFSFMFGSRLYSSLTQKGR